jgi:hypothetical protein
MAQIIASSGFCAKLSHMVLSSNQGSNRMHCEPRRRHKGHNFNYLSADLHLIHCRCHGPMRFEVPLQSQEMTFEALITDFSDVEANSEQRRDTQGTKPKVVHK